MNLSVPCEMASRDVSPSNVDGESQFSQPPPQSEQTKLQMLWDESMKVTTPYVRYRRTIALLLSWDDEVDGLKTEQEVVSSSLP